MTNADLFDYVKLNAKQLFGSQFWEARLVCKADIGPKLDKLEPRILVLSKFRLFFLSGKVASKLHIEASYHLLSVTDITALGVQSEINLIVDGRRLFIRLSDQDVTSQDLAIHLLTAFKHYFPHCDVHRFIELSPSNLYATYCQLPSARPTLPCNGFRRTYASLCDFYKQIFRDEIVWDVEKIYSLHNCTVLRLDDFSHLSPKDLIPLVSTLQFSSWFTGIASENLKLSSDVIDVIIAVLKKSQRIKELTLKNCGLKLDFLQNMAQALTQNPSIPLEILDLTGNTFDDNKSVTQFANSLVSLNSRLQIINFEECCLTVKGANSLCSALQRNQERGETPSLTVINFAKNLFKDDVSELYHLVCHSPSLSSLNLSGTGLPLEKLWASLKPCSNSLTTLKLSGCVFSARKSSKDISIQTSIKEFISSATALKTLELSDCNFPPEVFKFLVCGLVCNQTVDDVCLDLARSCTEKSCITVLETCMPNLTAVSELSLRDCGLEQDVLILFPAVGRMPKLRRLDIGGNNFVGTRKQPTKQIKSILMEIVKLISDDDSPLRELCLSDCRIGVSLCVLLNALGVAPRLKLLDISGNEIGNFGARLLAKALQVNCALETLLLDRNQITFEGYSDIVYALKENNSLLAIPYPIYDAADSLKLNKERTEHSLTEIERYLRRNNNNQGFTSCVDASSWVYETHSKLLLGNVEEELNKVASRTAQLITEWKYSDDNVDVVLATKLLQDAENAKTMLDELLNDVDDGDFIVNYMKTISSSLASKVDENLKADANTFVEFPSKEKYSVCQNSEFTSNLRVLCLQKAQMNVTSSVFDFSKALKQRYGSVQFMLATTVSEKICQELLKSLNNVNKILSNSKKSSISSGSGAEKLNSTSGTPTGKKKFKWFSSKNRPLSIVEGHGVPNFADLADDHHEAHERCLDGSSDNFDNNSVEIFHEETKIIQEEASSKRDGTQPLTHVQKGRARPPRNHKVKAPQPPNASDHEGVDVFFANKPATLSNLSVIDTSSPSAAKVKTDENLHRHNLKIEVAESPSDKRVSRMPGVPVLMPGVLQQLGSKISPRTDVPVVTETFVSSAPPPKTESIVVEKETGNYPKIAKLPPPKPSGIKLPIHSTDELHSASLKSPTHRIELDDASSTVETHSTTVETHSSSVIAHSTTTDGSSKSTKSASSPTSEMHPTSSDQSQTTSTSTNKDSPVYSSSADFSFVGTVTSTPVANCDPNGAKSIENSSSVSMEMSSSSPSTNDTMFATAQSFQSDTEPENLMFKKSEQSPSLDSPVLHEAKTRSSSDVDHFNFEGHNIVMPSKSSTIGVVNGRTNDSVDTGHHGGDRSQDHNGNTPPVFIAPRSVGGRPERPPLPSKPPPSRPPTFQRVWDQPAGEETNAPVIVAMRQKLDTPESQQSADHRKSVMEMKKVFEASKAHHSSMTTVNVTSESKPVPPPRVRTNKVAPTD